MTSKIFRSTVFVAVVVLLCSLGVVLGMLYQYFSDQRVTQLREELSLAVTGTEQNGSAFLENVESDLFRLTWIDGDGTVLLDTQFDRTRMGSHADREEFLEALQTGTGSSVRYSETRMEKTLYEARRLADGTVLRISGTQVSAGALVLNMQLPILLLVCAAVGLCAILARRMAKRIVGPINRLDLEHPLKNDVYPEISPLLRRINQQHLQIAAHMEALRRRSDEFAQITGSMKEGLVLLDSEGTILSINPTAKQLFGADDDCVGRNFLLVERSQNMRSALNAALDRGRGTTRADYGGRDYQFDLSRIASDGTVIGAVVLAFDITETLHAERTRREFSANVSHELKTPLQSILGSAELLENGLVKPEDTSRFAGHIRTEAARLVELIEDIIRLSQLDEGVQLPREEVDLLAMAREVIADQEGRAAQKQVTVQLQGGGFAVCGVRRLLHEILYNLCDNAIKYNVPGGSVTITVQDRVLTVADTGIGIPPEHQSRIFERFYRVDKSHSKASGGTGLGLSIVKHAVQHLGAELRLESVPGQGTTVTVIF